MYLYNFPYFFAEKRIEKKRKKHKAKSMYHRMSCLKKYLPKIQDNMFFDAHIQEFHCPPKEKMKRKASGLRKHFEPTLKNQSIAPTSITASPSFRPRDSLSPFAFCLVLPRVYCPPECRKHSHWPRPS